MKILLIHNFYGSESPSGENIVFEQEKEMLISAGHEINTLEKNSDSIRSIGKVGMLIGALSNIFNPLVLIQLLRKIKSFRPDVIHVHNTFPLISWSVFIAAKLGGVPIVYTLHNYRLVCTNAILLKNHKTCEECLKKIFGWPGFANRCYRNSRIASLSNVIATSVPKLLGVWSWGVSQFIVLSEFQRNKMIEAGFKENLISVKGNFLDCDSNDSVVPVGGEQVMYLGRLSAEKGVEMLIKTWSELDNPPVLKIVGDGELKSELDVRVRENNLDKKVLFTGFLTPDQVNKELEKTNFLVLPSIWYETFGMVILEAFAKEVPVIVSNVGGPSSIVEDQKSGFIFKVNSQSDLNEKVEFALKNRLKLQEMKKYIRETVMPRHSSQQNLSVLEKIYRTAINQKK
ncbi:MAG: glycosyltransferase family 4 protein [Deltaproteobacteria bacterium]|jgi:glycosyltransferase involved in cell wall biosynthesis|nr:glycosyltransferase family 4 protein [Deltaproteobacteria bacterium]